MKIVHFLGGFRGKIKIASIICRKFAKKKTDYGIDLEFAAWRPLWLRAESQHFQASAKDTTVSTKYGRRNLLSALEIFRSRRYMNWHFTYLLTYLMSVGKLRLLVPPQLFYSWPSALWQGTVRQFPLRWFLACRKIFIQKNTKLKFWAENPRIP